MNLASYQLDPSRFQADIRLPTDSGDIRFGAVMADFQRERFAAVNPSLIAVARGDTPPVPRFWDERTKGASKDSDWAVNLLWLLMFSRRTLRIQIGAYDADQADEVRQIIRAILRIDAPLNKLVASVVKVQADKVINSRTDSVCEILTRDSLGGHGARPNVLLLNELSHIGDKEFAETLMDNLDKMPNGLGIIASNAGFLPSWQAEWKAVAVSSARWIVWEYTIPAPWVSEDALSESRRRNSVARYNRLWRGIWAANGGDALNSDDIDAAVSRGGRQADMANGWAYLAGLDLGLSRDAAALATIAKHTGWCEIKEAAAQSLSRHQQIMVELGEMLPPDLTPEFIEHPGTGRLKVVSVQVWKPEGGRKVDIEQIEQAIIDANEKYEGLKIGADPWQAAYLVERLRKKGVQIEPVDFTGQNLKSMCSAVLEAFSESNIDLPDDPRLLSDLRSLRVEERSYGCRLVSPRGPGGHGDAATAMSIALHLARQTRELSSTRLNRPLLCFP